MIRPPRWSDRLSGTSHLLIVVLVAAVAAAFPVTISAHASANQTASAPTVGDVRLDGSPVVGPQAGASRRALSARVREIAAPTKKRKVRPPVVAVHRIDTSAPSPTVKVAPAQQSASPVQPIVSAPQSNGYGCGYALAYLSTHAAPGFSFECPGYSEGHQAMTCVNVPGLCPGTKLIAITTPCAAAYMNEASNSWVLTGQSHAPIDPYGYCQS